jgi:glycosyltransferase involved in cell wall biosynthesis
MALKIKKVRDYDSTFSINPHKYNKNTADVAVVMPCNNRPIYAVQAILSVLNQDYSNLVLLCVGKPDDQIKKFLELLNDKRVVYLINPEPTLASSTNIALEFIEESLPRVTYITRCDDDDWLAPNKVRVCRNFLRMNPQTDLVHHGYYITNKDGKIKGIKEGCFIQEELIEYSNIYDGTIMLRAEKVRKEYLDEKLPGLPYYDWFIRLHKKGLKMDYMRYNGYYYRQHGTNNVKRVDIKNTYRIIRKKNKIKDVPCDVMFCYTWLGRESGITTSVKHCSSLLENVKIHKSPNNSLYALRFRAELCKPKLIIIEDMNTPTNAIVELMDSITWPCNVVLREHGKAAFSDLFWKKMENHERVIQISKWYKNLFVASTNLKYSVFLAQLYDSDVLWLPNTFNEKLMTKDKKRDKDIHVSILCEIRPLKNIISQLCACQLIGKEIKTQGKVLNVHLLKSRGARQFIDNLNRNRDKLFFNLRWHPYMDFEENQMLVSRMDLALQISYTETMNYYALEHLMQGIPTLTSEAIEFGLNVPIDDPLTIAEVALKNIGKKAEKPQEYVKIINEQFLNEVKCLLET